MAEEMIIDQVDEVEQQDPPTKHKITQKALNDFASTIEAKPNLTSKELLQKFPEFNNDLKVLQSAFDYHATSKSGKYKTVDELNGKFPEFEFTDVKKKDIGGTESISKVQSISPTKWEDNVLNPASQFATSPTQPKEVKPTKAKAPFSESGIFGEEGNAIPTISQTPDADRLESHKNPKDNRAGYLWNKLTKGIGSLLSGNSDNFINAMSSILPPSVLGDSKENVMKQWREQVEPITRDFVEKKIGSKTVTKEQEQKYNDEFLTSAAGGLLQSAPAMLAPKGAKLVAMVTQAQDDALQSINSTKLGKDLPESTKSVFSLGVGIAQGALEKFGFDKIFGKASGAISKKIAGKVFKELVEKSDAPITRELYEQALDTYLKTAKQQLIKGGTKIGKGGAVEFLTGSLQEGSTVFAESILNSKTGLDVFEPKSWGDQLGRILKSGAQEAVGGLVLGGASYSMSNVDNYIADKVSQAQTPEDIDNIKREVVEQVSKDGTATPEAVEGVVKLVDDYARVKNKIPADVPNKKEVTDRILEREDIEQQIAQKKQEIQNLDPAFQKPAMIEVELLEKRVAELNNEISKVEITPVEDAIESQVKENEVLPTDAVVDEGVKKNAVPDVPAGEANYGNVFQPAKSSTKTLNEKQQELVNELPKQQVNYKELKGIGDLSIYLNNPDALNSPHLKSAKKIYEDIKSGKTIRDTPSVNEKMEVMDGQNRIAAQLAAGIENIDVAVIDKSFYDKQNQSAKEQSIPNKTQINVVEETPKWEEVKQKSTTEFREPEKVKEMFLQELPDTKEEIEYTDVMDGKTKLERPKYIKRELKKNHQILEALINCLTK